MEFNQNLRKDEYIQLKLREIYRKYGYLPYRMGRFEEYELYMRNRNFLRNDRILTFTDTDGKLRAMKPDITLSIVRDYDGTGLQKLCYSESVFRPGNSGFRQIEQSGLECIGKLDPYLEGEVLMLAVKSLKTIGEGYLLDISHVGFVSALADQYLDSISTMDILKELARKNADGIRKICAETGIDKEITDIFIRMSESYGPAEEMLNIIKDMVRNSDMEKALKELSDTVKILREFEPDGKIMIDLSMADDRNYYSGLIFRGMTEGIPEYVLSGGRYDKLLKRMGKEGNAIGFAVYLDLLGDMDENRDRNDCDILLIRKDTDDPRDIVKAVDELIARGLSVRVEKEQANIRCEKVAELKDGALRIYE